MKTFVRRACLVLTCLVATSAAATDAPMGRAGTPAPVTQVLSASSPVSALSSVTDAMATKLVKVKITTIGQLAVAPLASVTVAVGAVAAPQIIADAKAIVSKTKGK